MYTSVCFLYHHNTAPRPAPVPVATPCPTAFSDALSPTDLVAWLSQQFQAKGLTLDPTLGKNLIGKIYVTMLMCILNIYSHGMYMHITRETHAIA